MLILDKFDLDLFSKYRLYFLFFDSRLTKFDPRKPEPPVINILTFFALFYLKFYIKIIQVDNFINVKKYIKIIQKDFFNSYKFSLIVIFFFIP